MLSHRRLISLIDIYGTDPLRWPEATRSGAEQLLRVSEPARAHLEAARLLDVSICDAGRTADAQLWGPGDQEAAVARMRSLVGSAISAPGSLRNGTGYSRSLWFGALARRTRGLGLAVGCSLAVAAGFFVGSTQVVTPASHNVIAILQPALLQVVTD